MAQMMLKYVILKIGDSLCNNGYEGGEIFNLWDNSDGRSEGRLLGGENAGGGSQLGGD